MDVDSEQNEEVLGADLHEQQEEDPPSGWPAWILEKAGRIIDCRTPLWADLIDLGYVRGRLSANVMESMFL